MIEARGLVKRFGTLLALDDLDFRGPVRPNHGAARTNGAVAGALPEQQA
jgi:hypothetical protein